jgi:hypothetical protein
VLCASARHPLTVSRLASVELARGPADDPVPVSGHPEFQPGMTRIFRRGRPHAGPVRAAIGADPDQIKGSPYPRRPQAQGSARAARRRTRTYGEPGPDVPGGLGDRGCQASLGDDGQVAGLETGRQPRAQVRRPPRPEQPMGNARTARRRPARRAAAGQRARRASARTRRCIAGIGGFPELMTPATLTQLTRHSPPPGGQGSGSRFRGKHGGQGLQVIAGSDDNTGRSGPGHDDGRAGREASHG